MSEYGDHIFTGKVAQKVYTAPTDNTDIVAKKYIDDRVGPIETALPLKADLIAGKVPITQLPHLHETRVVANIAARNAITGDDLFESLIVWVIDASADPTVNSGAALYIYTGSSWGKLSEAESLDVTLYTHPNHGRSGLGDATSVGDGDITVRLNAIDNTKLADMAQARIKGRASTAGTGDPTDLDATQVRTILNVADGANNYVHPNHSGDVHSSGDGITTIQNLAVTNAKINDVAWTKVTSKPSVLAGSGLTGGGSLASDVTITMGTPSSCSTATSNAVTSTSHTHALTGVASSALSITAGNGLTGGGDLSANRTIALGTPDTCTNATSNATTATSHTHAVSGFALSSHTHADYVPTSRSVSAGNGLTGGGTLDANVTINMGTPGTSGPSTNNAVTSTSHTHRITTALEIVEVNIPSSTLQYALVNNRTNLITITQLRGADCWLLIPDMNVGDIIKISIKGWRENKSANNRSLWIRGMSSGVIRRYFFGNDNDGLPLWRLKTTSYIRDTALDCVLECVKIDITPQLPPGEDITNTYIAFFGNIEDGNAQGWQESTSG